MTGYEAKRLTKSLGFHCWTSIHNGETRLFVCVGEHIECWPLNEATIRKLAVA